MPHTPTHTHTRTRTTHATPRQQVLYTLATEVLALAERLENATARARWVAWADALLLQMHMEADVDAWRVGVGAARVVLAFDWCGPRGRVGGRVGAR